MSSQQSPSRHSLLPRASEDSESTSPHSHLWSTSPIPTRGHGIHTPNQCSFTISPLVFIRALSTIFILTSFIILVIDGGSAFIAACVFLALMLIVNTLMLLHYSISHIFKVTVELRGQERRLGLQRREKKVKMAIFLDVGLAGALALCLLIGNAVKRTWGGVGAREAGIAISYIVVLLEICLAVTSLDGKSLSVSVRLNDLQGKSKPDVKQTGTETSATGGADLGEARRRDATPETGEERRPLPSDDLV